MSIGTILIRADANVEIGTGHIMRCLALAQAWRDAGGSALFASLACTESLRTRLANEGFEHLSFSAPIASREDARATLNLLHSRRPNWIVLDGYGFGPEYENLISGSEASLARIDDQGECADSQAEVIVNQNLHAKPSTYSRCAGARLLLGPRFALLRREFKNACASDRHVPSVAKRILISMGGTDPRRLSATALEAVRELKVPDLQIRVAVSSANQQIRELELACQRIPGAQVSVDASMPELMRWADLAVAAAGLICWEMCFMGLPALLIDVAENQTPIASSLHGRGIAIHLGNGGQVTTNVIARQLEILIHSQEQRRLMSQRSRELVDGHGADRIVAELQKIQRTPHLASPFGASSS